MKFARKRDLFIIAALIAAALLFWAFSSGILRRPGAYAQIYHESKLVKTVRLDSGREQSFSLPQAPSVVFHLYEDGSIAFIESDCPDKICIKTGRLHAHGQMAACLPNGMLVKVVEEGGASPDLSIG